MHNVTSEVTSAQKDDRQWFYESTRLDRMDTDLPESEDELDGTHGGRGV